MESSQRGSVARFLAVLLVAAPGVAAAQVGTGILKGVVTESAKGLPIAGAEVVLAPDKRNAFTDDSGRFRIADLQPGHYELRARRIGFQEYITIVAVVPRDTTVRNVVLRQVATLNPIEITADPVMADFEENRRIGLGRFMTRSELEKVEHRKLGEVIEVMGAKVSRLGPHAWLGASRGPIRSLSQSGLKPKCYELEGRRVPPKEQENPRVNPGCSQCWAAIWLDDRPIFSGEEGALVPDLNFILPQSVEAIEYYKGPASTPMKYSKLNSQCGVLVIHTRRTPGPVKQP